MMASADRQPRRDFLRRLRLTTLLVPVAPGDHLVNCIKRFGTCYVDPDCMRKKGRAALPVEDAGTKAKVILKEIMDQHPADHDLTAIGDVWLERMADGVHLVYLTPTQLAEIKQRFDDAYTELIATSG